MAGTSTKANSTASNSKSKKKKGKKKPAALKVETNGEPSNGIKNAPDTEAEEAEEDAEPETVRWKSKSILCFADYSYSLPLRLQPKTKKSSQR
jgi:hypothetical protein